jgi:fumarylacetoacetase
MNTVRDESHDPSLRSWVTSANEPGNDFPIQNLPFGVFTHQRASPPRIGVAIGTQILDLQAVVAESRLLAASPTAVHQALLAPTLNTLMALGHDVMRTLRLRLVDLLKADSRPLPEWIVPMSGVELRVPAAIGDYTDFYASVHHATRVGSLFRPDNPLLPNYKHMPIAYHGRSSSIVPSGTSVRRPWGQARGASADQPAFRPTASLDYELEVGILIGRGNALGHPVSVADADDHLFGLCLLNDWSARDVQQWESQPLGPFLAKSFATSVSPWIVTVEALAPYRCAPSARAPGDPVPLPYLAIGGETAFDVTVEALLATAQMRERGLPPVRLGRAWLRDLYWTPSQMIAHHTSNGCNLRPGDLLGSGTVSGADDAARGCLLEMTANGRHPIELPTGETRAFLADGDQVILRGSCAREGYVRIGFGECSGIVAAA